MATETDLTGMNQRAPATEHRSLTGDFIVIAAGTTPRRPDGVDFDEERVLDSDEIISLSFISTSMVVVGAGVIGIEYASIFAALGSKVTVVEKRDTMLDFCDPEVVEALRFHLRDSAVTFRFGEEVTGVVRRCHRVRSDRQGDSYGMLKLLVSTENSPAARRPRCAPCEPSTTAPIPRGNQWQRQTDRPSGSYPAIASTTSRVVATTA